MTNSKRHMIAIALCCALLLEACSGPPQCEDNRESSTDSFEDISFSDPTKYGEQVKLATNGDADAIDRLIVYYSFTEPLDERNLKYWVEFAYARDLKSYWTMLPLAYYRSTEHGCGKALLEIENFSQRDDITITLEQVQHIEYIKQRC